MASSNQGPASSASPPGAGIALETSAQCALRSSAQARRAFPPQLAGVTLVELLIVIAILGILAAAGFSVVSGSTSETALAEGLRRLAGDLSYAQSVAFASASSRTVVFDPGNDSYLLLEGASPMRDPITKRSYVVHLDTEFRGSGLNIVACNFAGGDTLRFLGSGVPAAGGWVTLRSGTAQGTLAVSSSTGRISWRVQ